MSPLMIAILSEFDGEVIGSDTLKLRCGIVITELSELDTIVLTNIRQAKADLGTPAIQHLLTIIVNQA